MKTESQIFISFSVNGFPWISLNFDVVLFILISASLLQALEKQQEALVHFREAVKLAPCNFEAQKGNQSCCLLKDIITCVCSFYFYEFCDHCPNRSCWVLHGCKQAQGGINSGKECTQDNGSQSTHFNSKIIQHKISLEQPVPGNIILYYHCHHCFYFHYIIIISCTLSL